MKLIIEDQALRDVTIAALLQLSQQPFRILEHLVVQLQR